MAQAPKKQQGGKKQFTKEETAQYYKDQQEKKIKLAGERDTKVVTTETREAIELSSLVSPLDFQMKRARLNSMGRGSKVSGVVLQELVETSMVVTNLINHLLARVSKLNNSPYRPPRGFVDATKASQRPAYLAEIDDALALLTAQKKQLEALIASDAKRAEAEAATAAAKKQAVQTEAPAATAAAKAPKKAKADTGVSAAA